jgi:hypothetical protein
MKKYLLLFVMALSLSTSFAFKKFASFTGYISCAKCTGTGQHGKIEDHAACAAACVKGGQAVVLITSDGKVIKIANQDKALAQVGKKVTIDGKLEGDTLTISSIKAS